VLSIGRQNPCVGLRYCVIRLSGVVSPNVVSDEWFTEQTREDTAYFLYVGRFQHLRFFDFDSDDVARSV